MRKEIALRTALLTLTLLAIGDQGLANANNEPPQHFNVLPQQPVSNYLITWQPVRNAYRYEVWEHNSKGRRSYLGTTKSSHWQLLSHSPGDFRYEVRTCASWSGCGTSVMTDWITVGAAPKLDPNAPTPPASSCLSPEEYQEAKKIWNENISNLPPDESDEKTTEDGSVEPASPRSWEIGLINNDAILYDTMANPHEDTDLDCLPDSTDSNPNNPDRDGDGWFDGPCNVRFQLVLTNITSHDEQEDLFDDEFYVVVDDSRFPHNSSNDQYWDMDDGTSRDLNLVIAERTRGTFREQGFAEVVIKGMENDPDVLGTWAPDDILFNLSVDMNGRPPGETFTVNEAHSDWNYSLTFRIDAVAFADPSPDNANADTDKDGITEQREATLNAFTSGLSDPEKRDIFVEVDTISATFAKRSVWQVVSAFARENIRTRIYVDQDIRFSGCIGRSAIQYLQDNFFDLSEYNNPDWTSDTDRGGFRYAIVTSHENYGGSSGVAQGGNFIVGRSWLGLDNERGQAGTFIHELGHSLGLRGPDTNDPTFEGVDTIHNPDYRSSMNYTWQTQIVNYAKGGGFGIFGSTFDDWGWLESDGIEFSGAGHFPIGSDACD